MLALPAELKSAQANACLRSLVQGMKAEVAGGAVVVDAVALTQFDSSALAVLLGFRRECLAAGKGFAVHGLPAQLRDLAGLYGISDLLPAG